MFLNGVSKLILVQSVSPALSTTTTLQSHFKTIVMSESANNFILRLERGGVGVTELSDATTIL